MGLNVTSKCIRSSLSEASTGLNTCWKEEGSAKGLGAEQAKG